MFKDSINDQMTPRERLEAFSSGREMDRLPFILHIGDYASNFVGANVSKFRKNANLMVEGQLAVFREYGADTAGIGPALYGIPEAMGAKLFFPEKGVPYIEGSVINNEDDLERFLPADPYKDGRLPIYLEASKMIDDKIGAYVPVSSSVGGPFTGAAALRGSDIFLKDLYRRPEWVHRLMDVVTSSIINYIEAVAGLGLKVGLADPLATGSLLSPRHFNEFAFPYLKKIIDRIKEIHGKGPHLHICGDTTLLWSYMADTGASALSLDNVVDLEEVKAAVGARVVIGGNVHPVDTMLLGSPRIVAEEVRKCLRKAWDSPKGFIVCPGCALPMNTPRENVSAFAAAVRKYAQCPVNTRLLEEG